MKFLLCIIVLLFWSELGVAQNSSPMSFRMINSHYDEQSAVISPDGKVMYVTLANHPQNVGGKKDTGDIHHLSIRTDHRALFIIL